MDLIWLLWFPIHGKLNYYGIGSGLDSYEAIIIFVSFRKHRLEFTEKILFTTTWELLSTYSSVNLVPKLSIASISSSLLIVPSLLWSNTRKAAFTSSMPWNKQYVYTFLPNLSKMLRYHYNCLEANHLQPQWSQFLTSNHPTHSLPGWNETRWTFFQIIERHYHFTFITISTMSSSVGFCPNILKIYPTDLLGIWSKPWKWPLNRLILWQSSMNYLTNK